ncbi:MAG: GNAT family N-acetyltransferase [Desulfurococcales archaeon]|nr:GNAT family N-acetyltransferase [Desulfurococcales archaeon]
MTKISCGPVEIEHPRVGSVRIRSPEPADKNRIKEFYERLSMESIYHRFFRLLRTFDEIIDKMLGDETLICLMLEKDGEVIGCSELYKTVWPDTGEPAVAVRDDYQGRGLGKLLVYSLAYCALRAGIRKFRIYVFKENIPAIRIAFRLKSRVVQDYGDSFLLETDLEKVKKIIVSHLESVGVPLDRLAPSRG